MEFFLRVASSLLILITYGESYNNGLNEERMFRCYIKLVCQMDKFDEILEINKIGGPELEKTFIKWLNEAFDFKESENSPEFWKHYKDVICGCPDEQAKKIFGEFMTIGGEHYLEVCRDPESEMCLKIDSAGGHFISIIAKYQTSGDCPTSEEVPEDMMPGGMGKMPSLPLG